jgi:hypothetical protein
LLSFSACFQYWAVAGLETPIYALLLLLAVYGLVAVPHRSWTAWPLGLLAITRPEGVAFSVVALVFLLLRAAMDRSFTRAFALQLTRWAATIALIAGPYFVFRWLYFGSLLPNTYFAKITSYTNFDTGVAYAWSFLVERAPYVLAALPLLLLPRSDRGRPLLLVFSFVAVEIAVIVRAGGDWMPRSRFMTQVLPLLVVLTGLGVQNDIACWRGMRAPSADGRRATPNAVLRAAGVFNLASRLALGALALFLFGRLVARSTAYVHGADNVSEARVRSDAADYRDTARLVMEESARRGWISSQVTIALEPVGIIPYVTRSDVIDLSGKTSREIARAVLRFGPEHHREKDLQVSDLVFRRRPEFFCKSGGMHPSHQEAVMADPRFELEYQPLGTCGIVTVFVRRSPSRKPGELGFAARRDGLHRIDASEGAFAPLPTIEVVGDARTALADERTVLLSVEVGGPATWFDELATLGSLQVRAQGEYFASVALTRGEPSHATVLAGLRLNEAAGLDGVFSRGSAPWKIERDPSPHIAFEGAAGKGYHLLLLAPIAVAHRGLCLAWAECRAERRHGEPSGLYWSTSREDPSHMGPMIDSGSVPMPDASGDWSTLSAVIPITGDAKYVSIGVGGTRNGGTTLWVRELRVVMIPEFER